MLGGQDGVDEKTEYHSREKTSEIVPSLRVTYRKIYDNDNDGVYNQIDIDDDNDGILDTDECTVFRIHHY